MTLRTGWTLSVVTATVNPMKTLEYWSTWRETSGLDWNGYAVVNGGRGAIPSFFMSTFGTGGCIRQSREILGVVPAFQAGLDDIGRPLHRQNIVAFLHDDLAINEYGWDQKVMEWFYKDPDLLLLGFGGALGVGSADMYRKPFDPYTLARHHFISNMRDAEAHGRRVDRPTRVAVLDGFSMIGRGPVMERALLHLMKRNVIHHAYDVAFGCEVRRQGGYTLMLPIACHHAGGQTAVGEAAYAEWAKQKYGGDHAVWTHAHHEVWDEYRDVLPFLMQG